MAALGHQAAPKLEGFGPSEEVERPILIVATNCESNFRKSLQFLNSERQDEYEIVMQKLEKRFLDWAAYLGVFAGENGSLDQRLKHYPQYRDLILLVLDMLNVNLLQTTIDPSEPSSDESSDDEVDRREVEFDGIQRSINELDRLAIHIRQSSSSSLDARVKSFASRKPAEVSSFETKAILAVNVLYPEASESLRKYLGKSMTQRHTKLLYWRSHEKKLRTDRRRDEKSRDESAQSRRESSPLPIKESLPQPSAIDRNPISPKTEPSRVSIGTSALSGTLASDLGSRFAIPIAEAKIPSLRRAGASTVLESTAKFPSPPQFEDGEVQKPCPLCQKIFPKVNYTDNVWWRCHVNEDLLPFVCISSSCLQSPTFASRSDWRAHTERDHDVFWRRGPSNPMSDDNRFLHSGSQEASKVGPPADICPLCCLPLDDRHKPTNVPLLSVSSASHTSNEMLVTSPPGLKNDFDHTKKGTKTVRFEILEPEEEQSGNRTSRSVTDLGTKSIAPTKDPVMNSTMNPMMNHIADHLQFLALLTLRLSTEKLARGDIHVFSSSQSFSSDEGLGKRSTLDDEIGSAEGDETLQIEEDSFLDEIYHGEAAPGLASPQNEWIDLGIENVDQKARLPDPFLRHFYQRQLLQRLWDQAYNDLKDEEPKLIYDYERILMAQLSQNNLESLITEESRCRQMLQLVQEGLDQMQKVASSKVGTDEGLQAVQALRGIVDKEVKAAPEAAVALVGVCYGLEIISDPMTKSHDNRKGIAYMLSRMEWYWNLVSLFLDENKVEQSSTGLEAQLEKHVVQLYKKLISYQMRTVCLYHGNRVTVMFRDTLRVDDWVGQLSEIQAAEYAVQRHMEQHNIEESQTKFRQLTNEAKALEMNLRDLHQTDVDSVDLEDNARAHIGNAVHIHQAEDRCLSDLRVTDPRHDKARIEATKGGLIEISYRWILEHSDFRQWCDDEESRLLWIKGDPGKGKTMLLCGIVNELTPQTRLKDKKANTLLSYFFCQAADERINSATAVLRGLIYLIVEQQPSLISHIQKQYKHKGKAIFEDVNAWSALSEIFLNILEDASLEQAYMIIDALDECVTGLPELLDFISKNSTLFPRVKWIVSSRNWPDIEERLNSVTQQMRLCLELTEKSISAAVDAYIEHKVNQLAKRNNYNAKTKNAVRHHLSSNSNGTFLWVALVCQNLEKISQRNILIKLSEFPPALDAVYERMMEQIHQQEDVNDTAFCCQILATVSLVYRPVTLAELGSLLESPDGGHADVESIHRAIGLSGSFLTVRNSQVCFIHPSAKDYLSHKAPSTAFLPSPANIHGDIFLRSIQAMSTTLRRNIYNVYYPGLSSNEIKVPDPDPLSAIRYSCVHWIDHLCDMHNSNSQSQYQVGDKKYQTVVLFLRKYSLYWLEALGLVGHIEDGIRSTTRLEHLLNEKMANETPKQAQGQGRSRPRLSDFFKRLSSAGQSDYQLLKLVQDLRRFMQQNSSLIANNPLQVYTSALVFSPSDSLIRKVYKTEEPEWLLNVKTIVESIEGPNLQILESQHKEVQLAVFSSDGGYLALGPEDHIVKIWDTRALNEQHTLAGHSGRVNSIVFSADIRYLASGSDDTTIIIWDTATGKMKQTLKGHSGRIISVAFSEDIRYLASASDDKIISIWDMATNQKQQTININAAIQTMSFDDTASYLHTNIGTIKLGLQHQTGAHLIIDQSLAPVSDVIQDQGQYQQIANNTQNATHFGYGLSTDKCWITWNGHNVLWLPPDYQPSTVAVWPNGSQVALPTDPPDTVMALCHGSGRVVLVRMSGSGPIP
ncbi:hypothetical protein V8C40DRAFT_231591 [Trichoderma camerunense]